MNTVSRAMAEKQIYNNIINQYFQDMESGKIIKLFIQTVSNITKQISVSDQLTGFQLKEYIVNNVSNSLGALEMKLQYAGVKIQDDKLLSQYKFVQGVIKILQMKCDLDEIPGLIVAYEIDPISQEAVTYRMPCGHVIGRDCITMYIRSLIQSNVYTIKCPSRKPNGKQCEGVWDFALCRKVGVFTKQEVQEFQIGLSKNWIRQFTLQCPNCQENLYQGNLTTKRVRCPRCKYGDFCSLCCKKWIATNNNECGNKGCNGINDFLKSCPWDRIFKVNDLKTKTTIQIKTPRYRACVNCNVLLQNTEKCKHTGCPNCKKSFCWICLSSKENNNWKCSGPFDYCGVIAQVQQLNLSV